VVRTADVGAQIEVKKWRLLVFGGVHVADLFSFLCFVCLSPVSCVPNVASVSGLSYWFSLMFMLGADCKYKGKDYMYHSIYTVEFSLILVFSILCLFSK